MEMLVFHNIVWPRFKFRRSRLDIGSNTVIALGEDVAMQEGSWEIGNLIDFIELFVMKSLINALLSRITVIKGRLPRSVLCPFILILFLLLLSLNVVGITSKRKGL